MAQHIRTIRAELTEHHQRITSLINRARAGDRELTQEEQTEVDQLTRRMEAPPAAGWWPAGVTGPSLGELVFQELVQRHASSWFGSAADWPAMVFRVEGVCMATLQQQISDKFLAELAGSEPTDQRLGRLTESWRSTGIERDPQKLF